MIRQQLFHRLEQGNCVYAEINVAIKLSSNIINIQSITSSYISKLYVLYSPLNLPVPYTGGLAKLYIEQLASMG